MMYDFMNNVNKFKILFTYNLLNKKIIMRKFMFFKLKQQYSLIIKCLALSYLSV